MEKYNTSWSVDALVCGVMTIAFIAEMITLVWIFG